MTSKQTKNRAKVRSNGGPISQEGDAPVRGNGRRFAPVFASPSISIVNSARGKEDGEKRVLARAWRRMAQIYTHSKERGRKQKKEKREMKKKTIPTFEQMLSGGVMQASGAKAREMLVSEGKGRQEAPPRGVNLRLVAKNFLLSFAFCCCYLVVPLLYHFLVQKKKEEKSCRIEGRRKKRRIATNL